MDIEIILKSLIQRMPFLCLDSFGSFAAEAGMEDIKVVSGNLGIEIVAVEFAVKLAVAPVDCCYHSSLSMQAADHHCCCCCCLALANC